jgi:hypothetical protein
LGINQVLTKNLLSSSFSASSSDFSHNFPIALNEEEKLESYNHQNQIFEREANQGFDFESDV